MKPHPHPALRSGRTRKRTGGEAALKRAVVAALQLIPNVQVMRMQAGVQRASYKGRERVIKLGEPGTPDLLVLLPYGRTCWIELKARTGEVRPTQRAWFERAQKLHHIVSVCRDVGEAVAFVRSELERGEAIRNICVVDAVRRGRVA